MNRFLLLILLLGFNLHAQKTKKPESHVYYPGATWERKTPESLGFDPARLQEAIDFAIHNEVKASRSMEENHYQTFGVREPLSDPLGPLKSRGAPTGIILKNGYIVAEWGEPSRVDMTHSVTKSFLSATAGVLFDRGLINSLDEPVGDQVAPVLMYSPFPTSPGDRVGKEPFITLFDTPHNKTITWNHLLRQVSDWEGTLWGKPDWADRPDKDPAQWTARARNKPGTVFEYNDVRVNVLALALLSVARKPLPEFLKENLMDPIGASTTWRWFGYDNSWIILDGKIVQSVSGGGHWGGGMIINAYDMARFGYLTMRDGKWNDSQLVSKQWIAWSRTPTGAQPSYGFMNWFLNTEKKYLPSAPESAFAHIGNGTNMIYVDKENDLVAVVRWIDNDALDGFVKKLLEAKK